MTSSRKCSALFLVLFTYLTCPVARGADPERRVPTIDDLLALKSLGGARISPDGKWVAYGVTHTDFKQDAFVTQLWLADTAIGKTRQLTRGDKSAGNPQWSPDGKW